MVEQHSGVSSQGLAVACEAKKSNHGEEGPAAFKTLVMLRLAP